LQKGAFDLFRDLFFLSFDGANDGAEAQKLDFRGFQVLFGAADAPRINGLQFCGKLTLYRLWEL
jgi:hypothetical protein